MAEPLTCFLLQTYSREMNPRNVASEFRAVDLDPPLLTQLLRRANLLDKNGSVTDVEYGSFGTGQSGESVRFVVTYDPSGSQGPATLVGKFASPDASAREFAAASGFYEREVRFYRELACDLPIRTPRPLHTAITDDATGFVILMEDLAPAKCVDQLQGCTPDQAACAMEQAAALHAGSWRRPALQSATWLSTTATAIKSVATALPDYHTAYVDRFATVFTERSMAAAERMVVHSERWAGLACDPICLWHQDFRSDNMLFDAGDGTVPLAVVDWQTIGMGPGTADVSYFMGTSLTTETRRAHERDLLAVYHQRLTSGGVRDYSFDECWNDYRRNVAQAIFTVIHASVRAARTERGDEMWNLWADRSAVHAEDLETFDVLASTD